MKVIYQMKFRIYLKELCQKCAERCKSVFKEAEDTRRKLNQTRTLEIRIDFVFVLSIEIKLFVFTTTFTTTVPTS